MKNMQATSAKTNDKASSEAAATLVSINFSASSGGTVWTLTGEFPVINEDAEGSRKLWQAAFGQCVYRSTEARKALPDGGGEVDSDALWLAINALSFRGEELPNKKDKADAEGWWKAAKAGVNDLTPEKLADHLTKKYGVKVSPTLESITLHFFRERLKEEAAKAAKLAKPSLDSL